MVEYRQFQPDDAEPCRALLGALARELALTCVDGFATLPAGVRKKISDVLTSATHKEAVEGMFCVVAGGRNGMVAMGALDGDTIKRMFVIPRRRGEGIGTAIFDRLQAEAHRRGLSALQIRATLGAVTFYERLGFVRAGEKTWQIHGATLRLIRMTKEL